MSGVCFSGYKYIFIIQITYQDINEVLSCCVRTTPNIPRTCSLEFSSRATRSCAPLSRSPRCMNTSQKVKSTDRKCGISSGKQYIHTVGIPIKVIRQNYGIHRFELNWNLECITLMSCRCNSIFII
jgi:hypothetical protein